MHKYVLAFIKRKDEILLINRNYQPWQGCWNGIGGKIEKNETPLEAIIRETYEETGLMVSKEQVFDKGLVTWNSFDAMGNGLHVFLIHIDDDTPFDTPKKMREGILDFKPISWASDKENYGVSYNIPYFIEDVIYDEHRYEHYCVFNERYLKKVIKRKLDDK